MTTNKDDNKTRLADMGAPSQNDATVLVSSNQPDQPLDNDRTILASTNSTETHSAESSSSSSSKKLINNRFQLETLLGSGGMGSVYKALDQRKVEARDRDPYVALKLLNEDFKQHPDAFISLQREARKSQTLAHPNIVTVYDFDRDGNMVFMTMEFMEGHPLDELIRKVSGIGFEFEKACGIFRDISHALTYAHSKNIIHSDFKPGNIFVTSKGLSKVFDFGIARAVSSSGNSGPSEGDKTVFDAGSLSALTPAYASYEMLKGEEPSTSDDVYALACVAYELFAGKHPFNKTPADKACEQNLKPEKIKRLNKRQWKALAQALSFKNDKRTQTVAEFEKAFFSKSRMPLYGTAATVVIATAAAFTYQFSVQEVEQEQLREELTEELQVDLRADIELEIKQQSALKALQAGLSLPLDKNWDSQLNLLIGQYMVLAPEDEETILQIKQSAMSRYLDAATRARTEGELQKAESYLVKAGSWQNDTNLLNKESSLLANARQEVQKEQERQRLAAEEEARKLAEARQLEQERLAQEKQARDIRLAREKKARTQRLAAEKRQQDITQAISAVNSSLTCNSKLDINGQLASNLNALRQLSVSEYDSLLPKTIDSISGCIQRAGTKNPQTAFRFQSEALQLFPNATAIKNIKIDFCAHLKPGSGKNGQRYYCNDQLTSGGKSPALVVAQAAKKKLAMTRFEVTVGNFNDYCQKSGQCNPLPANSDLPVHNINIKQAKDYASWLSAETGYDYRIPTYNEWLSFSSAESSGSDPDRNCYLKFGNLLKGLSLVKASSGKQNDNGIVNHVGNVQEWTFNANGELLAAGGSRKDPLKRCLVTTQTKHSGQPDEYTGFRLIRNVL